MRIYENLWTSRSWGRFHSAACECTGTYSRAGRAVTAEQVKLSGVSEVFMTGRPPAPLHAVGPIDLALRRGEFFAVVGPSGCGKSTLLELIAGLTPATEGWIEFEGRPIAGQAPDGVGVVFQDDASLPWLNVADNVAFGLRRANLGNEEKNERVRSVLKLVGLSDFATS